MGIQFRVDPLRELAFGSISTTYANLGTPFTRRVYLLKVVNLTDSDLKLSFDGGINDNDILPANGGYFLYDINANQDSNEQGLYGTIGTQLAVKTLSGSPSSGSVYATIIYSK